MNKYNFLGFHSIEDFSSSFFRCKDWLSHISFGIIGMITTFITGYIWTTPEAIWTLWTLMMADWITGIIKSTKTKEFVSYKLFRMPIFFVATSFIVSISWWIAKSSPIFYLLPPIVLAGFYSVYFLSLLENCGELKLLPKSLIEILKNKFGLKVLTEKFLNKDK